MCGEFCYSYDQHSPSAAGEGCCSIFCTQAGIICCSNVGVQCHKASADLKAARFWLLLRGKNVGNCFVSLKEL